MLFQVNTICTCQQIFIDVSLYAIFHYVQNVLLKHVYVTLCIWHYTVMQILANNNVTITASSLGSY